VGKGAPRGEAGGGGGALSAAETVQRAARATLGKGSARIRTLWDADFNPEKIAFGSEGVVDLTRRRSRREDRSGRLGRPLVDNAVMECPDPTAEDRA
jgi:hypothetical protein